MNYLTSFEIAQIKAAYNYFDHTFGTFKFNFAVPVDHIELTVVSTLEMVEMSVREMFAVQRNLRRTDGLNEWIILKIYYANGAQSFMSFDH